MRKFYGFDDCSLLSEPSQTPIRLHYPFLKKNLYLKEKTFLKKTNENTNYFEKILLSDEKYSL